MTRDRAGAVRQNSEAHEPSPGDATVERAIWSRLAARGTGATICPSEVARSLASDGAAWRDLMPQVRATAARLQAQGRLRVSQRGLAVDANTARGPIRLALPLQEDQGPAFPPLNRGRARKPVRPYLRPAGAG